jgi:hypothetical protein
MATLYNVAASELKNGDEAWYKDMHLLIKVRRTRKGFKRRVVFNTRTGMFHKPAAGVFLVHPSSLMISKEVIDGYAIE